MEEKMHLRIKDHAEDERPVEKCLRLGVGALSDAELVAVVIRTGSKGENAVELAERVLSGTGIYSGLQELYHLSLPELLSIEGIGAVKAVQLQCLTEISRRMSKDIPPARLSMTDPQQIAGYFMEDMRHKEREELRVVFFDTRAQYIHDTVLFQGTVNSSVVSPREVFLEAFRYRAVYLCMLHNHPSGSCEPSQADISFTQRVKMAGELVGIQLIDHIIIGGHSFCSMKEQGIL